MQGVVFVFQPLLNMPVTYGSQTVDTESINYSFCLLKEKNNFYFHYIWRPEIDFKEINRFSPGFEYQNTTCSY